MKEINRDMTFFGMGRWGAQILFRDWYTIYKQEFCDEKFLDYEIYKILNFIRN